VFKGILWSRDAPWSVLHQTRLLANWLRWGPHRAAHVSSAWCSLLFIGHQAEQAQEEEAAVHS